MELKKGYTTGTCAAIASKAALKMIFLNKTIKKESVLTPKGIIVEAEILEPKLNKNSAVCAVKKYSGNDPDITNGILIFADVTLTKTKGISIDGGKGVGRVTKSGLAQKIGSAAINDVPKQMIINNIKNLFDKFGYNGGVKVTISVPSGEKIAKKTFNPRLGIIGGISILGTTGIVEPMSEKAIIDTIKAEINVKRANEGEYIIISPGNYGLDFIKKELNINLDKAVKCGNFIGEALDFAAKAGFKGIILIGHIGKFIKLSGGIMNTHSKNSDCRMEIIAANTALFCENLSVIKKIMECVSTDEAINIIKNHSQNILDNVMKTLANKALFYAERRIKNNVCFSPELSFLTFSNVHGILEKSENFTEMIKKLDLFSNLNDND